MHKAVSKQRIAFLTGEILCLTHHIPPVSAHSYSKTVTRLPNSVCNLWAPREIRSAEERGASVNTVDVTQRSPAARRSENDPYVATHPPPLDYSWNLRHRQSDLPSQ